MEKQKYTRRHPISEPCFSGLTGPIARLLAAVRRHLKDARYASIGDESRFDIAYKAVMQCALSR